MTHVGPAGSETVISYAFSAVVITELLDVVEAKAYRSEMTAKAALAKIARLECEHCVPFHFFKDPAQAARQVERWAYYFAKPRLAKLNALATGLA